MNHNEETSAPAGLPAPPAQQDQRSQALHDKEMGDLRDVIAQLLMQLEHLQQQQDGAQTQESKVSQLRDANEHLILATFSAQDKQADAEASMQRQTNFLSMLAHELRNPLQPIAYANALLGKLTGNNPDLQRLHGIIYRQTEHMKRLIDDLLDASRISSGKIRLDKSILSLADIIAAAAEASQPGIDKRQQRLRIVLPAAPAYIHGDRVRLAQAFSNLLNNASKFSSDNEDILLSAHVSGTSVQITVCDKGIGIATELQPFIFDLFTQGLLSLERAQGGLGIGLTLVRSLLEMHGGTVRVDSDGIGLGATFTVILPLMAAETEAEVSTSPLPPSPAQRSLRILLVEDNLDIAEMLSFLLELGGHSVTQCHDGLKAVEIALAQPHDVVICDIGLPGLDGFSVVERIRAASPNKQPLFIATSGYSQAADHARAVSSGFDHYLTKPIAIDVLLALIALHVC